MTGDEMDIINPNTSGKTGFVDRSNKVHDEHDCVFAGDHSNGLDENDRCTICGKTLGDMIVEGFDPLRPRIPIILDPNGGQLNG